MRPLLVFLALLLLFGVLLAIFGAVYVIVYAANKQPPTPKINIENKDLDDLVPGTVGRDEKTMRTINDEQYRTYQGTDY